MGLSIGLATVLMLTLELLAGRHKGVYRGRDRLVIVLCAAVSAATRPMAALLVAAVLGLVLPQQRNALSSTPLWLAFPAVLLVTEFTFYWVHRWAHESQNTRWEWLWKLHRTHHSGGFMNVLLTLRVNPFWTFVVPYGWVLGGATWLGMEKAAALTLTTIYGWNLITHSAFRADDWLRARPIGRQWLHAFEHVLVTPGIHHTHHGWGRDGKPYRNFATTLSMFDALFGTLHLPEGKPSHYGLPGPNAAWTEEVFYPLVQVRSQSAQPPKPPRRSASADAPAA